VPTTSPVRRPPFHSWVGLGVIRFCQLTLGRCLCVRTGWQDTTSYYGDAKSFLFSIYPRISVYRTTGKATNYVFLNTKKTFSELPIGRPRPLTQLQFGCLYVRPCASVVRPC
jgi:hypothetical protein